MARKGEITIKDDMRVGRVHPTKKSGDLEIVCYKNSGEVDVRFLHTGSLKVVAAAAIRRGNVRDLYFPTVVGVGYVGGTKYKPTYKGKHTKAYLIWYNMLYRCYEEKSFLLHPTYKDCIVCEDWYNFQEYARWYENNYKEGFQVDKDIKIEGNKIYSPETCTFVSTQDNVIEAQAKNYCFTSPTGEIVHIYNLRAYCKENSLSQSGMCGVYNETIPTYKGWVKFKEPQEIEYE